MPENINVEVLFFNERAVGVTLPNFIEQAIMETEPGFRGDTATGATKPAKISTGASVNVPLFINVGDIVKIDTRTGEYLERLGRAYSPWPQPARRSRRGREIVRAIARLLRGRGLPRGRDAGARARRRGRRSTSTRSRRAG